MKRFWKAHQKLHIWLLADLLLLGAFFLFRGQRAWMNAIQDNFTGPLRQALGRLCYRVEFSVMELSIVLAILAAAAYILWSVWAVVKEKGRRGQRAYSAVLGAACVGLSIYAIFCLLWGVNFWTDSFQEKSGIYAEPVAVEDLLLVTVYFAQQLSEAADDVERSIIAYAINKIKDIVQSPYALIAVAVVLLAIVCYVIYVIQYNKRKRRRRRRYY